MYFVVLLNPPLEQVLELVEGGHGSVDVGLGVLLGDVGAVARVGHPRSDHSAVLLDQVAECHQARLDEHLDLENTTNAQR